MRGGLRGELREPDDVGQADGDRAELLRRRNLTLLQLQEFVWGGAVINNIERYWHKIYQKMSLPVPGVSWTWGEAL